VKWSERPAGSPEVELVPELDAEAAPATLVIDKAGYTSLTPEVRTLIAEHGLTDVYTCAASQRSPVLKTAVDVFASGLVPWLITDASASHGGVAPHEAGLLVARRFIGDGQLITTNEVRARLAAD